MAKVEDPAATAGKQLEAFFLRRLLSEARPQGGMIDGGFAGDTFKGMLDEALADKMSAAGGVGMAEMFQRQLGGKGAATKGSAADALPMIDGVPRLGLPLRPGYMQGYGPRVGHDGTTHMHQGLDMAAQTGTPVAAAAGGTVTHAGPEGDYGNLVTVRHANGYETRYAHLSGIGVAVGDAVQAGQPLGTVGSTGLSDAPHLHFEVRRDGEAIDPAQLLPLNNSGSRTNR
jgi:murein DD-endopeptidase MepM/ murein hydrolase activator NlpD